MRPRAIRDQFRLALMLMTRLPVGRLAEPLPRLADARWAFPFVGLPVGAICWAVQGATLGLGASALMAAVLALGATALATGGLHHDGLADFADGIGGGRDRAHCLEIMRDSRIGSYGVLALILVIMVQITALGDLGARLSLADFLLMAVASRVVVLVILERLPPARAEGLGHTASGGKGSSLLPGALLSLALVAGTGLAGAASVLAMAVAGVAVARLALRRINGQTGDVLGASQILSETAGWAVFAMLAA